MPSTITDVFKKQLLRSLVVDIDSASSNYYMGIGRSQDWDSADNVVTPVNSIRDIRNFQSSMQSIKAVGDYSYVIPRYNWTSGSLYQGFDDNQTGHPDNSFYVITDANSVYLCLRQGRTVTGAPVVSTVKPTGALTTPFITADGYVWKFLYTLSALTASKYLAANFMPVKFQDTLDSASPASDVEQKNIQDAALPGQIGTVAVIDGGSGYSGAPTVQIVGDGSGASADAFIDGGVVTKIEIRDSAGSYAMGSGYSYADIVFSGGGGVGANARAVIGPASGFGADPRDDLKSIGIMFNTKPAGEEGGDFIIGNDFRQVALIRNPKKNQLEDSDFTNITGNALDRMNFASITTPFTPDNTLLGSSSQAKAFVDKISGNSVYYHQTEETGYTSFEAGELVSEIDGSGSGTLDTPAGTAFTASDVDPFSGDVLLINNSAAIARSVEQTEDLKIVIQI